MGGVQTYLLDLSKYNKKYGISRSLLCLYGSEGRLKKNFINVGVNFFSCNIMSEDNGYRPYRLWKFIRKLNKSLFFIKLFRTIRRSKPDIIICEEPSRLNTQLFVSSLLRIPFIWHIHNEYQFEYVNKFLFKMIFKYFLKKNLFIVSDSKYILNTNLAKYKSKINGKWAQIPIIPATADLTDIIAKNKVIKNQNTNIIQLGSVGRLTWQKDYQSLIRIISLLRERTKKEIFLSIAGTGPLNKNLEELIIKLNLENYVRLVGHVDRENIPSFLNNLDIYVQSSITEGSPITIKEAMAASLPIVSTSVGGIPELIVNGETGFLVPTNDNERFTDAILKVINIDSFKRKKIGENALNFIKRKHSLERIAKKMHKIYKQLLNN